MSTNAPRANTTRKAIPYGSPIVYKGRGGKTKVRMFCWDFVGQCDKTCGIRKRCVHLAGFGLKAPEMEMMKRTNICIVQKKYLDIIYETLMDDVDKFSEQDSISLGLHLMPLYGHLIKMKIAEASMNSLLIDSPGGKKSINPIYREIRETIRLISTLSKDFGVKHGSKMLPNMDFVNGDPEYYDRMMRDEEGSSVKDGNGYEDDNGSSHRRLAK